MSMAERKCALLLTTLGKRDRRAVLGSLPAESAGRVRRWLRELESLPFDVADLAGDVLASEVRGLTATTSPELDSIIALSRQLAPAWFARVLAAWPSIDRNFCLSMMETADAQAVRRELAHVPILAPKVQEALQLEALRLAPPRGAA